MSTAAGRKDLITTPRVLTSLVVYVAAFLVYAFVAGQFNHDTSKQLAEMFNAFGVFVSGIAMLGVIAAILLQRQQNQMQSEELRLQREELQQTREELRGQREALEAQNAQQRRTSEAALMQQLMTEYDGLRDSIQELSSWIEPQGISSAVETMRWAVNHKGPLDPNIHARYQAGILHNDHRHAISRFFVKVRKLATTGYIDYALVVISLDRRAVELFLMHIDPLDMAVAGDHYKDADREYFKYLLEHKYPAEIRLPHVASTTSLGWTGHSPSATIGAPPQPESPAPSLTTSVVPTNSPGPREET